MKLPRYVVQRRRPNDRMDFYFHVPAAQRPEKWPDTIRLPKAEAERTRDGSTDEIAAVIRDAKALNKQLDAVRYGKEAEQPHGTLDWLMGQWRQSRHWTALSANTRRFYEQGWLHVEKWSAKNKQPHVSKVTWPVIFKLVTVYDDRPAVQRQVRNVLQKLTQMAFDKGLIAADPWANQKKRAWNRNTGKRSHRVATWKDVLKIVQICYRAGYPSMGQAAAVAFDTMQYPSDLIGMRFQHEYREGQFIFARSKTDVAVITTASKYVKALLGRPNRMFLFEYEGTGRPYTIDLFRKVWRRCIKGTEYEGFQFKWLRHSAVAEADAAGCAEHMTDAMGAWKPGGSGKAVRDAHYRKANQSAAEEGMALREQHRKCSSRIVSR